MMLRHGSIRQDLPHLAEAVHRAKAFDTSRIMLVTDGIFPDHLISWGNMNWVVAEAVKEGIDPVRAIQMATIIPARYFRLDHLLGGIAPGRMAHLLVVDSLEKTTPGLVLSRGAIVAENGVLSVAPFPTPEADMVQEIKTFHGMLADAGCTLTYPLRTLGFLTFTSVL